MLFTAAQLFEIKEIIKDYHDAFIINAVGDNALPEEIVKRLKEKGLINPQVNSIQDAYLYGQILSMLETKQVADMSYSQFKAYVKKNPIPLTVAEKQAIQMATLHAGQFCQGLGNKVGATVGSDLIEADSQLRARLETDIRTATAENIVKRETVKQLKSDLGWKTKDWARDWDRIAVTEKQTAMQEGVADGIRKDHGGEAWVSKIPQPGACDKCIDLHIGKDTHPRIFKLSTLEANGTNFGKKAADWLACVGTVHPNCCPENTMITTVRGLVPIQHVVIGDLVYTHKNRWKKVTHLWESVYEGDLVSFESENGQKVRATPNHPFLNGDTWTNAEGVKVGDKLAHGIWDSVDIPSGDLDTKQGPTVMGEKRFFASVLSGFSRTGVPVTAVYFNGDFFVGESQIDVEGIEGEIDVGEVSQGNKFVENKALVGRAEFTGDSLRFAETTFFRVSGPPHSVVRFLCERFPLFARSIPVAQFIGDSLITRLPSSALDAFDNGTARHVEMLGYTLNTHQLVEVHLDDLNNIDVGAAQSTFSGHVSPPKASYSSIANVDISVFVGRVYNLTVEGDHSYVADGYVTHNCQCQLVRVPKGWGYDEEGDLVPGGKGGKHYEDEKAVTKALRAEQNLQKAIQNNRKIAFQGFPITIEQPVGSTRTWRTPEGETGETRFKIAYGFINRTQGMDGDEIDVFVGPDPSAENVYVIEQRNRNTGTYDEAKAMMGFSNEHEAELAYRNHYDNPDEFILSIQEMDLDHFRRWVDNTSPKKGEMGKADVPVPINQLLAGNPSALPGK